MNPTLNANLAGFALHFDEQAYRQLKAYLDSVRQHLGNTLGRDEIIQDVEARLVEIFQSRLDGKRDVIGKEDVDYAIEILGKPEAFSLGEEDQSTISNSDQIVKPSKRIFRDPDNKALGGVCGGLGAYFGIDPVWIRLAFVALTLLPLGGILVYIIMWIVVPMAKTTADKLQMRGEAVNLSTIERSVREELFRVKETADKGFPRAAQGLGKVGKFADDVFKLIGRFIRLTFQTVFKVIRALLIALGIFGLLIIAVSLFWSLPWTIGHSVYSPKEALVLLHDVLQFPGGYGVFVSGVLLFLVPPALFALSVLIRYFFKLPKLNPIIGRSALVLSILGFLLLGYAVSATTRVFKEEGETIERIDLPPGLGPIFLKSLELGELNGPKFSIEINGVKRDWYFNTDAKHIGLVNVEIHSTQEEQSYFRIERHARGVDRSQARKNASSIVFIPEFNDTLISIPTHFTLFNQTPFRGNYVEVKLYLNEGTEIYLDPSLDGLLESSENALGHEAYRTLGFKWKMTNGQLVCLNCPEEESKVGSDSKDDPWQDLENIPERP